MEQQRNGLLSKRNRQWYIKASEKIADSKIRPGFSINDTKSKSKGIAIRPALPSLWRTGTNGIRELYRYIRASRFIKRGCHRPKQWLVHDTCVVCSIRRRGTLTRKQHSDSKRKYRDELRRRLLTPLAPRRRMYNNFRSRLIVSCR